MSKNSEKYRRSLYLSTAVLSNRQECVVEKVVNSFDGNIYVRRSYREDKAEIYRLLAELKSPYIAEIVEIFENDGQTEIIERYIEGETLSSLAANGKITKSLAKSIARQLLSALSDIQKANIIHRDIKPENIIISEGKLLLIDFGIARIFKEEETRDTRHLGTEGYAAPEQYGFSQSDKRTDIYSAGKTILKVCETAKLKGAVRQTAECCAQFDPLRRFATAQDALKYLDRRQKMPVLTAICIAIAVVAATVYVQSSKYEEELPQTVPETVTTQKTEKTELEKPKQEETQKPKRTAEKTEDKTLHKKPVTDKTINKPQEKMKSETKPNTTADETAKTEQTEQKEQKQTGEGQFRMEEDAPPPLDYREHSEIIFGKGKILWLFYPGENAQTENTLDFCGGSLKVKALLKRKVLKLKLGEQNFDIIFGDFVSHYQSDTTILESDIYMRDIDGDGVEELFVGVRLRHGFAVSSTTLWFARYTEGKFILCEKPLYFKGQHTKFNIEANNSITTKHFYDRFHIEGYKFIKDKRY